MKAIFVKITLFFFLASLTLAVYWQIGDHGPINADDFYLTSNEHIDNAYSYQGLIDGMSSVMAGVWMPLTYLTVGAEMEFFGTDFGKYHLVSACLHTLNSILVFLLLMQLTGAFWRSALAAAIFTVHPLNVEPVSWLVGIRVLQSGFFSLLSLYCYAVYARVHRGASGYYTLALFFYAAGLFSVPMFIPLPFLLFLLDFWPLKRLNVDFDTFSWRNLRHASIGRLAWEKFPFFGIMIVLMAILLLSHDLPSTPIESYPLAERLYNAMLSYIWYIQHTLLPTGLAVFYPFPDHFPLWKIAGAALLLFLITLLTLTGIRRFPFLIVGWFWFAGMLFPLSGVAQIGSQARADHYMYLPLIGLIIIICWGSAELIKQRRIRPALAFGSAVVIFFLLAGLAWRQAGYWQNSVTVFRHALRVTEKNYEAHNYLGQAMAARKELTTAQYHFNQALAIKPDHVKSNINLANTYLIKGEIDQAIRHLSRALKKMPRNPRLQNNLGVLYEKSGDSTSAMKHYRRAVTIAPDYVNARINLAGLEAAVGNLSAAIRHYRRVLELTPNQDRVHFLLGTVLYQANRMEQAANHLHQALALDPHNEQYRQFLMLATPDKFSG